MKTTLWLVLTTANLALLCATMASTAVRASDTMSVCPRPSNDPAMHCCLPSTRPQPTMVEQVFTIGPKPPR